jgi:prevent-host-death family protein
MERVGVRELRQNLSKYLTEVKTGETFVVTERGREVARLSPSGPADSPLARLVAERGATMPQRDLLAMPAKAPRKTPGGLSSEEVLEEMREERL